MNTHLIPHGSALLGDVPVPTSHRLVSLSTPAGVHCTRRPVRRTTHKGSQVGVSKELFKLSKPGRELQAAEGECPQPTRVSQVSQQAWQGRQLARSLRAHMSPLGNSKGTDPQAKHRMNKDAQETHGPKVICIIFTLLPFPRPPIPPQPDENKQAEIRMNYNKF